MRVSILLSIVNNKMNYKFRLLYQHWWWWWCFEERKHFLWRVLIHAEREKSQRILRRTESALIDKDWTKLYQTKPQVANREWLNFLWVHTDLRCMMIIIMYSRILRSASQDQMKCIFLYFHWKTPRSSLKVSFNCSFLTRGVASMSNKILCQNFPNDD